jgi:phosphate transport system substrate-binding protein
MVSAFLKTILATALLAMVPGSFAAENGEALAVVVHKSNPIDNLGIEELRRYCLAERRHWPHGRRVTIVLREPGAAERDVALREVFGMNETEFKRHFLQLTFSAEVQSTPKELATGVGVRRFVVNVPGALGFVRLSEVDSSVKVVLIDGLSPTNAAYRLALRAAPVPGRATGGMP